MAKALYGHAVGGDPTARWENDRLRARVAELEAQVERLTLELAASAQMVTPDMPSAETLTPVLAEDRRPALA